MKMHDLIQDAINRWATIADQPCIGALYDELHNANCTLCDEYGANACEACPIQLYTGQPHCRNTPYYNFLDALDDGDFEDSAVLAEKMVALLEETCVALHLLQLEWRGVIAQ